MAARRAGGAPAAIAPAGAAAAAAGAPDGAALDPAEVRRYGWYVLAFAARASPPS